MTTTGEPLSDERLAEIRQTAHDAGWMYAESGNEAYGLYSTIEELLAEVERLRTELAAQGKLVELIAAEAWYGRDAPYYAEMRRILETHKHAWHTRYAHANDAPDAPGRE